MGTPEQQKSGGAPFTTVTHMRIRTLGEEHDPLGRAVRPKLWEVLDLQTNILAFRSGKSNVVLNGGPGGTRTPGAVRHRVYSAAELPLSDRPKNNFYDNVLKRTPIKAGKRMLLVNQSVSK